MKKHFAVDTMTVLKYKKARLVNALRQIDLTRVPPDIAEHITKSIKAFS